MRLRWIGVLLVCILWHDVLTAPAVKSTLEKPDSTNKKGAVTVGDKGKTGAEKSKVVEKKVDNAEYKYPPASTEKKDDKKSSLSNPKKVDSKSGDTVKSISHEVLAKTDLMLEKKPGSGTHDRVDAKLTFGNPKGRSNLMTNRHDWIDDDVDIRKMTRKSSKHKRSGLEGHTVSQNTRNRKEKPHEKSVMGQFDVFDVGDSKQRHTGKRESFPKSDNLHKKSSYLRPTRKSHRVRMSEDVNKYDFEEDDRDNNKWQGRSLSMNQPYGKRLQRPITKPFISTPKLMRHQRAREFNNDRDEFERTEELQGSYNPMEFEGGDRHNLRSAFVHGMRQRGFRDGVYQSRFDYARRMLTPRASEDY